MGTPSHHERTPAFLVPTAPAAPAARRRTGEETRENRREKGEKRKMHRARRRRRRPRDGRPAPPLWTRLAPCACTARGNGQGTDGEHTLAKSTHPTTRSRSPVGARLRQTTCPPPPRPRPLQPFSPPPPSSGPLLPPLPLAPRRLAGNGSRPVKCAHLTVPHEQISRHGNEGCKDPQAGRPQAGLTPHARARAHLGKKGPRVPFSHLSLPPSG